jgi:hypothetical protein
MELIIHQIFSIKMSGMLQKKFARILTWGPLEFWWWFFEGIFCGELFSAVVSNKIGFVSSI